MFQPPLLSPLSFFPSPPFSTTRAQQEQSLDALHKRVQGVVEGKNEHIEQLEKQVHALESKLALEQRSRATIETDLLRELSI